MKRKVIKFISGYFINSIDECFGSNNDVSSEEGLDDFLLISKSQRTHYDDDSNTVEFVVQRKSDGLFFKGKYEIWPGSNVVEILDEELEQVFPKEKTIIVYE